jgi:molybdopterin synthase catalytic subunit
MEVRLLAQGFDPFRTLADYQETMARRGHFGASAVFVGSMRDFNEGKEVQRMWLEHYPGMTERYLRQISDEALRRWELMDTLVVHRCGDLRPGDPIVLVAVWAAHRGPAFEACRYLIEELKARAPFWKREVLPEGQRWVGRNTSA